MLALNPPYKTATAVEAWTIVAELGRVLIVAYALAHLIARLKIAGPPAAMRLGLVLWLGFQAMLLLGSVVHEGLAWPLYTIHGGDAFAKTLVTCAIVGALHLQARRSAGSASHERAFLEERRLPLCAAQK